MKFQQLFCHRLIARKSNRMILPDLAGFFVVVVSNLHKSINENHFPAHI
jgi:hypothetical protein